MDMKIDIKNKEDVEMLRNLSKKFLTLAGIAERAVIAYEQNDSIAVDNALKDFVWEWLKLGEIFR